MEEKTVNLQLSWDELQSIINILDRTQFTGVKQAGFLINLLNKFQVAIDKYNKMVQWDEKKNK